jgi:hypothetical protein
MSATVAERSCQLTLEQQRFQNGGGVFVSFLVRPRTSEMVAIVTGNLPGSTQRIYIYTQNKAVDAQL